MAFLDQAVAAQTQRTTARSDHEQRTRQELINAKHEIVRLTQRIAASEKQLAEERMSRFLLRVQHERNMELIAMTIGRRHTAVLLSATPQSADPCASARETQSPTDSGHDATSVPGGCLERLLATLQCFVFNGSD